MITMLNRRELIITYDMKYQGEIRDILSQNHIDYKIVTDDRMDAPVPISGSRAYTGSMGTASKMQYAYRIYVRKEDYEAARALIANRNS
ncbi:hypothetical protein ABXS75_17240 [Roseburia hominis]